jgi:hypothetical protein
MAAPRRRVAFEDRERAQGNGNGAEAREALRRSHAIMVRLAALSPDNAQWKRDLDLFEVQIAELSQ